MLLISYAFVFCIFATLFGLYPLYLLFRHGFSPKPRVFSMMMTIIGLAFSAVGIYIMWGFVSYHYELVAHNKTTLEEMDRKRGSTPANYDVGSDLNWKFVFGNHKALWPVPYDKGIAAPLGDGVVIKVSEMLSESAVTGAASRANLDDPLDGQLGTNLGNWNRNTLDDPLNQFNTNTNYTRDGGF